MNKTYVGLILGSIAVLAIAASPSTLRREIPTTSELSRRAFTNETQEGWRNAIGAGQGSNAVVGSGTNGVFIESSGVIQTNLGIGFSQIPQASSISSNDTVPYTSDTNNPNTRTITWYNLLSQMKDWNNWPTSSPYSTLSGHAASADNATTANSAVDADNLGGSPAADYLKDGEFINVSSNANGLTVTQRLISTVGFEGDGSALTGVNLLDGGTNGLITFADYSTMEYPQTLIPEANLAYFKNALITTGATMLVVGDSMSENGWSYNSMSQWLARFIKWKYGDNGISWEGFDYGHAGTVTALNRPDGPTVWNGIHIAQIYGGDASNSVVARQWVDSSANVQRYDFSTVNRAGVFWLAWPGGDTFYARLYNSSAGIDTTHNLDGYAATPTLRYTNWQTSGTNNYIYCSPGASGHTNYLLPQFMTTNTPGLHTYWMARGSRSLSNDTNMLGGTNMLAQIGAMIQPDVILYHAKDFNETSTTTFSGYTNLLVTVIKYLSGPNTQVILVGTPARNDGQQASDVSQNYACKVVAKQYGWTYLDLYSQYNDGVYMDAHDITTTLHPTQAGARLWASTAMGMLNLNMPRNSESTPAALVPGALTNYPAFAPTFPQGVLTQYTNNGAFGSLSLGNNGTLAAAGGNIWVWKQATHYDIMMDGMFNGGGVYMRSYVGTGLRATMIVRPGYIEFPTNEPSYWPSSAVTAGGAALVNSNGTLFILKSGPGSTTWTSTNLWF